MKIGIAGTKGSFSEEAAREYVRREGAHGNEIIYLTQTERVLEALEGSEIDTGIFAIENSNGGVVTEYLPAIAKHRFAIASMLEIPANHMLLVKPRTKKEDLKQIISQRQALQQCRTYLKRQWPAVEVHEYVDTATAAQDLASGLLPHETGIIASRAAGEAYGLEVLEANVQDLKFNFTTFLITKRL